MLDVPRFWLRSDWTKVPATVDGVLGGFGSGRVPKVDVVTSLAFLSQLRSQLPSRLLAADCGAGIGRVTLDVLLQIADLVDLVEPVKVFADEIRYGEHLQIARSTGRIGDIFEVPLQEWIIPQGKYGLIWCQWCLGHLRDEDLMSFFRRAAISLVDGGLIIVKENVQTVDDEFDEIDNSVTRTDQNLLKLFASSGLTLIRR